MRAINLRGQRQTNGYLVAIRKLSNGKWLCRCLLNGERCKGLTEVKTCHFTGERTRSCGCLLNEARHRTSRVIHPPGIEPKCSYCGTTEANEYCRWQDQVVCAKCYGRASYRGTLDYLTCEMCGGTIHDGKGTKLCWECELAQNRCQAPYFYPDGKYLWADLDANVGQWFVLPAIDRIGDCLIWLGSTVNGAPAFKGKGLRGPIYKRYRDSTHAGQVWSCPKHTDCINPDHFQTHAPRGTACKRTLLTDEQVCAIRVEYQRGVNQYELAELYDVSRGVIQKTVESDPNWQPRRAAYRHKRQAA